MNVGRVYVHLQFEHCSHSVLSTQFTSNFTPIFINITDGDNMKYKSSKQTVLFKTRKPKEEDKRVENFSFCIMCKQRKTNKNKAHTQRVSVFTL